MLYFSFVCSRGRTGIWEGMIEYMVMDLRVAYGTQYSVRLISNDLAYENRNVQWLVIMWGELMQGKLGERTKANRIKMVTHKTIGGRS